MPVFVNIAAYKFVELTGLKELRAELLDLCQRLEIKGTILLSKEGINLFLAAERLAVEEFRQTLPSRTEFTDLPVKESISDRQPFTRMLVRIKREIIAFGVEGINPARYTSPRVTPRELRQWLDEGKPIRLLDTRNNYEFQLGSFDNALAIDVDEFRDFPEAAAKLPDGLKDETIVTFCTGGIRCEKAAPYLEMVGFKNVYQLDGGILKYFEDCGGKHYHGECFVFDQRTGVDPGLAETETTQCFACQAALTKDDCASPKYVPGKSCPYCHRSPVEQQKALLDKRNARLEQIANPLPGSIPYENRRPISISRKFDSMTVIDVLCALKTIHSREKWLAYCAEGRVRMKDDPLSPDTVLRSGIRLEHVTPATTEPEINAKVRVIHEDEAIVVLTKPAPLPMHPCGRFNRNTLQFLLDEAFHPWKLRPAHRLDANTSGIVVCSRIRKYARALQRQFEEGTVRKRYVARVLGHPTSDAFESLAAISREPTETGARVIDPSGLPAHTRFKLIRRCEDDTTLLEAIPITGRTNQIRVHLWNLGMPIVGDPLYLRDLQLGVSQTLGVNDPPLCLHATAIEFEHPATREVVRFDSNAPAW